MVKRHLFARKDPRSIGDGRSSYVYRREAGAQMGFGGRHRFPTLYVTQKIKDKQGVTFKNCPHFKDLRSDDTLDSKKTDKNKEDRLTLKKLDKSVEKIDEKMKKKKRKKSGGKGVPSIKKVRDHLRKIVKYHKKMVNESVPSIYPILGPANSDSESDKDDDWEDQKRKHTKEELKFGSMIR